jgi:hypothetical protein
MSKFKKGQSGNPSGRPKQESARIREKLNQHSDEIVKVLLEKVKEGDSAALKMALDRISPALKPTSQTVQIEATSGNLEDMSEAVMQAIINGTYSTDTLKDVTASIGTLARVEEVTALREKLESMEKLLKEVTGVKK